MLGPCVCKHASCRQTGYPVENVEAWCKTQRQYYVILFRVLLFFLFFKALFLCSAILYNQVKRSVCCIHIFGIQSCDISVNNLQVLLHVVHTVKKKCRFIVMFMYYSDNKENTSIYPSSCSQFGLRFYRSFITCLNDHLCY